MVLTDEIAALKKESEALHADGVNIIIALGHSGIEKDIEIANEVPLIDVVVGGHSDTFLYKGKQISVIFVMKVVIEVLYSVVLVNKKISN